MEQGRIILVDDDLPLLGFTAKYLARLGYQVTACTGSDEAWRLFSASGANYAVAVVDFTLRGVSGPQLARMMLDHNPEAKLVLTSGLHMDPKAIDGAAAGRVAFLHKPFTPPMLVGTIAALLGKSPC
jgi:two-component system, cell cycle sensor histidine kinase and response regulator CckA